MPFTREQAKACLESLGAAPIFIQSYEQKQLPHDLDIHFQLSR